MLPWTLLPLLPWVLQKHNAWVSNLRNSNIHPTLRRNSNIGPIPPSSLLQSLWVLIVCNQSKLGTLEVWESHPLSIVYKACNHSFGASWYVLSHYDECTLALSCIFFCNMVCALLHFSVCSHFSSESPIRGTIWIVIIIIFLIVD